MSEGRQKDADAINVIALKESYQKRLEHEYSPRILAEREETGRSN